MRQTAFALVLGAFLAAGLPAADQQLVNMVMPDAKVIAGINVDSARNSPFGTFMLSQLPASDAGFQKFVEASGFNPRTDLQEVLMATTGGHGTPSNLAAVSPESKVVAAAKDGLILARGNFNVEKISALAKADGKQNVETYNGAMLISDPNMTGSAMAFLDSKILVAGDLKNVKAAIDRRTQANTLDPELTNKVNSLSASQDAWAVSIAPLSALNAGAAGGDPTLQGALGGDLFKKITETSGGIKFGTLIQLTTELVAMDEKNATALSDVVKFLAGMVAMNAGPPKGAPPFIMTILQSIDVQAQGNVVSVTLSAPEDQVEGLINSMQPSKPGATKI